MIRVSGISYRAGGRQILHRMSFDIRCGELTVLLGANGAGKSTLMRILAGAQLPDQGQVWLDGEELRRYSPQALACRRAVLTQQWTMQLPFTCTEVVMMGRYPHEGHCSARENRNIVARCMKDMEVDQFGQRMFNTLSGGEQQRVQMARVLAQLASTETAGRRLLLLDEPTSSLDYLQQQLLMSKTVALAARGYAVVVVLHDLNLTARYADHVLLLRKGSLLGEGPRADILQAGLISEAYDMEIEVVAHEDYPFPFLVPALREPTHCG